MPRPLLRADAHDDAPLCFTDTLPAALREACWVPRQTITLAFWPMGQGFTAFEVKRCPQQKLELFNVVLITVVQEP